MPAGTAPNTLTLCPHVVPHWAPLAPLHPSFPCLFQAFRQLPGHQSGVEKVPREPGCRAALAPSLGGPWRSLYRIRLGDKALQRKDWEASWRRGPLHWGSKDSQSRNRQEREGGPFRGQEHCCGRMRRQAGEAREQGQGETGRKGWVLAAWVPEGARLRTWEGQASPSDSTPLAQGGVCPAHAPSGRPQPLTGSQSASCRSLMRLKPVVNTLPSARKTARMGRAPS